MNASRSLVKTAGNVPMVLARALWLRQERSRIEDASLDPLRAQAEEMTRLLRRLQEQQRFQQTNDSLRHTRVPIALSVGYTPGMISGDNVPLGMDEGMVRLAQVMGAEMALLDVEAEKQAGINSAIGVAKGAIKAAPGLASSIGRTIKAAPGALAKNISNTAASLNTAGNAMVQKGIGSVQNAAQGIDRGVNKAYNTARLSGKYDAARAENRVLDSANRLGNKMTGAVGAPGTPQPLGQPITGEMRQAKAQQRLAGMQAKGISPGRVDGPPTPPTPTAAPQTTNAPAGPSVPQQGAPNAVGSLQGPQQSVVQEPGKLPRFGSTSVDPLPTTPQQQAGSVGRPPPVQTAAQPGAAPPSAQSVPSGGGQAAGTAPAGASKTPEAATPGQPAQAGAGGGFDLGGEASKLWKRTGLADGAYKWKLPALAAGLGTMYAAGKGIQGIANYMGKEVEPAQYGGGPTPFQNVGAYGYPQLRSTTMANGSGLFGNANPAIPHLVKGPGGLKGEVFDLRGEIKEAFEPLAALTVDEFTNPVAASATAIKTAFATAITAQVFTGAALNGAVGATTMTPPRNITVTAAANAGGYLGNATITGTFRGVAQTETIAITDSTTVAGVKMFDKVTSISIPIQPDALGSISVGTGVLLGLAKTPKARAGLATVIKEVVDAVVVTTGTLSATNSSYTPAAAPNGAHDYALYYEYVPSL